MARRAKVETDSTLPKPRKRRKPMTPEQKANAAERLALAREKRAKANPPKYTNIHPKLLHVQRTMHVDEECAEVD